MLTIDEINTLLPLVKEDILNGTDQALRRGYIVSAQDKTKYPATLKVLDIAALRQAGKLFILNVDPSWDPMLTNPDGIGHDVIDRLTIAAYLANNGLLVIRLSTPTLFEISNILGQLIKRECKWRMPSFQDLNDAYYSMMGKWAVMPDCLEDDDLPEEFKYEGHVLIELNGISKDDVAQYVKEQFISSQFEALLKSYMLI